MNIKKFIDIVNEIKTFKQFGGSTFKEVEAYLNKEAVAYNIDLGLILLKKLKAKHK